MERGEGEQNDGPASGWKCRGNLESLMKSAVEAYFRLTLTAGRGTEEISAWRVLGALNLYSLEHQGTCAASNAAAHFHGVDGLGGGQRDRAMASS